MAENPFELPQTMRDVVEQNVKQAHAAYEQFDGFITRATGAMPANPLVTDFKIVQDRITAFAKENGESAFTYVHKISNAQTFQELLTHQMQFAQDRMQAFVAQTQELYALIGEAFQNSGRS